MASKSCLTLLLLFITWREIRPCDGLTAVDPPEDLRISDPGHLGHLEISWSPPANLINMTECQRLYQLDYFNTYKGSWSAVRTPRRTYRAQFDLTKDVQVRVFTLLSGPCTDGTMIKSKNYSEIIQKPPGTGVLGTAVQNFTCLYHNMKYLECKWSRGPKTPSNAQQTLYFWYKDLEQAVECPKYLVFSGYRTGCDFTETPLPDFTDIIFCVNGSSSEGPLKPAYTSLQIQNHVKPETTKKLNLQTGADVLELWWDHPVGRIPRHCLEWEVEHRREGSDGKITLEKIITREINLTLLSSHDNKRNCFRVRSKLHKYCADQGLWSKWSLQTCYPEITKQSAEAEWDVVPVYVCITFTIFAVLVLSLCVVTAIKMKRSRQEKRPESLTNLFSRNSTL